MNKNLFTSGRKLDHLRICAEEDIERGFSGFGDIRLVHSALPECDLSSIDLSTRFLGHRVCSPLFIAAMTGGHPGTREVNCRLARAAERYGLGMCVGSQRAALEDPRLEESFRVVREEAPHAFISANLGVVQLRDHGLEWADNAVSMIDADAIAVHLNFLQEAIQPEGDHDATGCYEALAALCRESNVPVIVKETGSGMSAETARACWGVGVRAIDIGGWGGTSWAAVEGVRAEQSAAHSGSGLVSLGALFEDWGIPTAVSLCEVAGTGGPIIATGGIRSGLDMARAIALGADLCGIALPLLRPAMESEESLFLRIETFHRELRTAMFLTGSAKIADQKRARAYITGKTRQMLEHIHGGK
ncbi:MAG TPA: type 2 isopentenyl-diphosphate Delta-isomerase [Methanolinea sp.]|nr:type 2 isopentenyl-diphosphate Delta-isomerase [Methanolinea sp.]HQK55553.1 type 2 isopentenyl-diphosphate Delta-isomerase [Methanolinea sp.]